MPPSPPPPRSAPDSDCGMSKDRNILCYGLWSMSFGRLTRKLKLHFVTLPIRGEWDTQSHIAPWGGNFLFLALYLAIV